MSGIVGIVNLDGRPVDLKLLRRMTEFMAFRGPDAQEIWIDGNVGFGHAMLRTTFESEREHQPFSLDGQVWITADARIDDRKNLISKIESGLDIKLDAPTDVELILRSYHLWGDDCLDHLLGDFSFAIWDRPNRSLFCARDHFGVKPFYYARLNNCLIFSNTLNCIRLHPELPDKLNDYAIGDFLLIGDNQIPDATFFQNIVKLPAAHRIFAREYNLNIRRYWQLPIEDELRFKNDYEYIEGFVERFQNAVDDRLRLHNASIFMSGGLDSTTIAALARKQNGSACKIKAFTVIYKHLIRDDEEIYAGLAAEHLDIPINYLAADDYRPYDQFEKRKFIYPEPEHNPLGMINIDKLILALGHSRVALTGEGGDCFLKPSATFIGSHLRELRLVRLSKALLKHLIQYGRIPRIGIRTRYKHLFRKKFYDVDYPEWINPDLESRLELRSRWNEINTNEKMEHPYRPEAYNECSNAYWSQYFEKLDGSNTGCPIEIRHPIFDTRLIGYSLRLPTLPWCESKHIMRASMNGLLHERIRLRPKAPMHEDPLVKIVQQNLFRIDRTEICNNSLNEYIDVDRYMKSVARFNERIEAGHTIDSIWSMLQPASLNRWLNLHESLVIPEYQSN